MKIGSLVILLGILNGVFCSEDTCRMEAHHKCRGYLIIPRQLPGNEDELREACTNLEKTKVCIADFLVTCNPEKEDTTQGYNNEEERVKRIRRRLKENEKEIAVATEICQEDSELHASFVSHMACCKEIIDTNNRDQKCMDYIGIARDQVRSRLDQIREEKPEEIHHYSNCLRTLFGMNCFLELFDNECSPNAKDMALEIINKVGSLDDQCPVSIRPDILDILDNWTSTEKKDIYVRELMADN